MVLSGGPSPSLPRSRYPLLTRLATNLSSKNIAETWGYQVVKGSRGCIRLTAKHDNPTECQAISMQNLGNSAFQLWETETTGWCQGWQMLGNPPAPSLSHVERVSTPGLNSDNYILEMRLLSNE